MCGGGDPLCVCGWGGGGGGFFFWWCGGGRGLGCFPARRSSDLGGVGFRGFGGVGVWLVVGGLDFRGFRGVTGGTFGGVY